MGLVECPPVSERHVQALWYDGALRPEVLRTAEGAEVRVVDPGIWNLEAGPDFRGAVLEVGPSRRRLCGDVEIHLRPQDWTAHRHAEDSVYGNLVAHVTWYAGPPPPELPEGCVSVCLGDGLRTRPDFSPDEIDLGAYPYARLPATPRPCEAQLARAPDLFVQVLRAAGARRLEGKARRLKALFVRRGDRAQTFYEEMMAAFGYKHNAEPFRALAECIPWRDLPNARDAAEVVLTCAASMDVARRLPWRTANVRPANSPARRIASAAALFAGRLPELLQRLGDCDLASREGQRAACRLLRESAHVGANRAAAMLANVVTPFALAEGRLDEVPDWLCPESLNAPVRLTAFRLLGRDHNPALYSGNGLLIQGLIQIHRAFCLAVHPDCSTCSLVRALARAGETC
ncbi:MAG: DUF2851 family protein [Kiritimatiellia bacterium]